jgi:hypothetical protein
VGTARDPNLRELAFAVFKAMSVLGRAVSYEAVKGLAEFKNLYGYLDSAGLVGKFGTAKTDRDNRPLPPDERDLWGLYVGPAMKGVPLTGFSEESFEAIYPGLEESLYTEFATWEVWAPLTGFTSDVSPVTLSNGIVIRQIEQAEKAYFENAVSDMWTAIGLGLMDFGFVAACRKQRPKAGPVEHGLADADFDTVITALRLVRSGAVSYNLTTSILAAPRFGAQFPLGQRSSGWSSKPRVHGAKFELASEDVGLLDQLVSLLPRARGEASTMRALDRFNLAYDRARPEDRIIDYWVALEALFLPGIDRGELSYRASLRAAYYVGSSRDRQRIFWDMRQSYDVRSHVVHGEKPDADVRVTAERTEEVLRGALRNAILEPNSLDMTAIDNHIVGQGAN